MEYVKYTTFMICFQFIGQASGGCKLDRDEYNKYPFVLKLVFDKVMRCHGALITPKYFIGPYGPLSDVIEDANSLKKLNVIGQVHGLGGRQLCYDIRQPNMAIRAPGDRNLFFGSLDKGFEVTLNNPYLYPRMDDYNITKIVNSLEKIPDYECCIVPVFDSKTWENSNIIETTVTYVKGSTTEYWWKLFCQNYSKCDTATREDNFFAFDPVDRSKDFSWFQGAMIVCSGNPLGMMSMLIDDTSSSVKITMFQLIASYATNFHEYADREWPDSPKRTTPTERTTTLGMSRDEMRASVRLVMKQRKGDKDDTDWKNDAIRGFYQTANILAICMTINALREWLI